MSEAFEVVSVEAAISLHALVIGAAPDHALRNVMDIGLLESALNRPRQRYHYENADLPALAATLLWGVIKNHPFFDGNKRTAWLVTQLFLYHNGYELPTDSRSTRLVLNIATSRRSIDQVEEWIRDHLNPAQQLWLLP